LILYVSRSEDCMASSPVSKSSTNILVELQKKVEKVELQISIILVMSVSLIW